VVLWLQAKYISSHVLPKLQPGGLPALVVSHGLTIKW
jgi:hypothetical protein